MTNRRLAVTSRSAAFSSPRWTRRARRRSSVGSLIRGSFWMSCRYWSKAPDGLARKNGFGLPPLAWGIRGTPEAEASVVEGDGRVARRFKTKFRRRQYRNDRAL